MGMTDAELRAVLTVGLRHYFDEHPTATRENIGSMVRRVLNAKIDAHGRDGGDDGPGAS